MNRIRSLNVRHPFILLVTMMTITGCAGPDYSGIQPLPTDTAPMAPVAASLPAYRVQIGDVLEIKTRFNPELNETVTVRPDGMISTAVAPDVYVYNLSVAEINDALNIFYKKELKDPRVSTVIRSFAPARVYVSGEVANPGEFVVIGPTLTLTQAIARAGGIKNSAAEDQVLIIRRGSGEKSEVYTANYDAATQGGDPSKDVRLAPYDVVFVPKSGSAMAYRNYEQNVQQYVQPTIGATYNLNNRSR